MDPVELLDQAAHDRFYAEFCRLVDARMEAAEQRDRDDQADEEAA